MRAHSERFWAKVNKQPDGCWIWTGARTDGYGRVRLDGRLHRAHRVAYEWLVGPIPDGLVLDHTCRTRACVNPAHLEAVTLAENTRRTPSWPNAEKTHCPEGHSYSGSNLYIDPRGHRFCRACAREADRRREPRQRVNGRKVARSASC